MDISGKLSDPKPICCGVPQGSVLGPLLFLVYINDLPLSVKKCVLDLFADDTTDSSSDSSILNLTNYLTADLKKFQEWSVKNGMVINVSKTKSHICSKNAANKIQATPAMSTSRISILSLMSKWLFIPNIFSLYIFAFQLRLSRKRLTWSNGYIKVIFHALDVFSIIFATSYVEVKNRRSHRCRIVCFSYVHVLPEVRKSSKQKSETISDIASFDWAINPLFSAIKSMVVLIRNHNTDKA